MAGIPSPVEPEITCTQLFINNEWVNSVSGKTFPSLNPMTEEIICQVQEADKADVEKAVEAAKKAFKRGSQWSTMGPSKRGALLNKLADLVERDQVYLASLETLDNGKPFTRSLFVDIAATLREIRYNASWPGSLAGETIPTDGSNFTYTRYEPFGVVGLITPWNFPLMISCNKLAPALAAGNTCVLKPPEQTPLTSLYLGKLIVEAGFPPGVVNIVPGYGPTAGAAITGHQDVRMVSFTGSTEVGRIIMEASAKSNLKRVSLELGGKSPNVIFPDVDIDEVVPASCEAVMFNMGECCIAGTRTFVHEDIYDEFVKKTVEYAKKKLVGDPFKPETELGPLIDSEQFEKVLGYMKSGVEEGAKLQCGGGRSGEKGYFVQPTVFSDVSDNMLIAREEIFGPVQSILKFKTIDEVIQRANDTTYGLGAAVFSKNIENAFTVAHALEAGTVWINQYFGGNGPNVPFGGYKQSGLGREGGRVGIEEFCELKTVCLKL